MQPFREFFLADVVTEVLLGDPLVLLLGVALGVSLSYVIVKKRQGRSREEKPDLAEIEEPLSSATDIPKKPVENLEQTPIVNGIAIAQIAKLHNPENVEEQSDRQFQEMLDNIPVPVLIVRSRDRQIWYGNQQAERMLSVERHDLIDRPMSDFYFDRRDWDSLYSALSDRGELYHYELPFKKADGTRAWAIVSGIEKEFNGESAVVWTLYDITYRVRVESMLQERSRLSNLGAQVGVALSEGGTLSQILQGCSRAIANNLNASFVGIWMYNPKTNLLELQSAEGEQPATQEFADRIPLGVSLIGAIGVSRQPYLTGTKENSADRTLNPTSLFTTTAVSARRSPPEIVALAGYPLVVENRLHGVMTILGSEPFDEEVKNLMKWVSNSIAVAIERVEARQALLKRRESLLFRLASQIRNTLELSDILQIAVTEIQSLLQLDRCHFLWCLTDDLCAAIVITHESRNPQLPSLLGEYHDLALASLTQNIQNRQILRIDRVEQLHSSDRGPLERSGIVSQLVLPLETRSGQLGAIVCSHCTARTWSDSEVELLRAVTEQLAIAINQAELYATARASALSAQTQAQQLEQALQDLQRTQEQLMQTEKMSSLGQLVAGIAHEINNPVTFITGNLIHVQNYARDLLESIALYQQEYPHPSPQLQDKLDEIDFDFVNDDFPKLLESIESGAERIRQIVLSLRKFSRLDESEMKQVDIHEGLESTLLILQHRLNGSQGTPKIEVVKEYGELPLVECYAGQLNQVFMNLLTNAIDAIERCDRNHLLRRITLRTQLLSPNKSQSNHAPESPASSVLAQPHVRIEIVDTGPGMSASVKARLFDPFFTTKPVGAGTGLGMSISYQIVVKQHRGSLQCRSQLGEGTAFSIEIPVRQAR